MTPNEKRGIFHDGRVTRRSLLFGAPRAIGAAAFLAACGSDDDEDPDGTSAPSAAPNTSAAPAATTTAASAGSTPAGADGDLASMLGVDAANAGGDITIDLGAVLALTGPGSFYGKTMSRGLDLAAAQIKAAG